MCIPGTPEPSSASVGGSSSASSSSSGSDGRVNRLPSWAVPKHYDVELEADLAKCTFRGKTSVRMVLSQATRVLQLNSAEIAFQRVTATDGPEEVEATSITLDDRDEVATFTFDHEFAAGEVLLEMEYTGILNDQMRGFYASTYTDANGVQQTLATTQFEAADCRRAIPSVDEPAAKATFTIALICPSEMLALSNMPVTSSTPLPAVDGAAPRTRHAFGITPIMSTYLVAFVIGKFDQIEATTADGTLIRCFATPGKGEQNRFALDVAVKLLPFYNEWFDVPYPLPKLDMIAVPDFAAGAMENWGLITYREAALLLDPANSSAQTKQWVAVCVAHEIAHQWFGNIVTMEWWTHLWLNEGFATWMENYAVDYLFPEWNMWRQFVYSDLNSAFDLDSLENSHAIEVPIYHACDVDEIFDTISYCKGCVVIRQLAAFLGPDDFRTGLQKYIKKFAYSNALTEDLWTVLSEVSGKDVQAMMQAWTKEVGYPIIELEEDSSSKDGVISYKAKQTRFLHTGPDVASKAIWPVPITWVIDGVAPGAETVANQVFSTKEGVLSVDLASVGLASKKPKWIKLNSQQAAMYRVRYPPAMFAALCEAVRLRDPLLTAADRLGVQNDAFALTRCGLLSTVQLLELVRSYESEDDYTVWADLCGNLSDISLLLQSDAEVFKLFSTYVNRLLAKVLATVGWDKKENEDHTTSLLRAKIIGTSLKYQNPTTVQTALAKFAKFSLSGSAVSSASSAEKDASSTLSPDLRSSVYSMVVSQGGLLGYETMLALHDLVTLSEEQVRCLNALGCSSDPALLLRTLEAVLTTVRIQDGPTLLSVVAGNKKGGQLCWEYCQRNWDAILKRFTNSSAISRIVAQTGNFTTRDQKTQVEAFFANHAHPGAERAVKQAIERIESNSQWLERDGAATAAWLRANVQAE